MLRMPINGGNAAFQGARRDGGNVVNESRVLKDSELGGHVAADGDDVFAFHIVRGAEHPVVVGTLKENLFARLGVNGAYGVVPAAEGNGLAVGGPASAVDGVKRYRV